MKFLSKFVLSASLILTSCLPMPALAMKISQTAGAAMLSSGTGLAPLANSGTLVIYSGTEPTNPDTALSGNTALATFTFSSTAFGSVTHSGGVETTTASFSASTVTAGNTGTATFAREYESNGTTVIADFTVGTSGDDINLNSTSITSGGNVTLSSFVEEEPVD